MSFLGRIVRLDGFALVLDTPALLLENSVKEQLSSLLCDEDRVEKNHDKP